MAVVPTAGVSWICGNAAGPLSQAVGTDNRLAVAASSPLDAEQASPPGARPFCTGLAHHTVTQLVSMVSTALP